MQTGGAKWPYQHQHVGDGDDVRLVAGRHGRFKVVSSVFPVGHCVVVVEGDVVLLDAFSGKTNQHFNKEKEKLMT